MHACIPEMFIDGAGGANSASGAESGDSIGGQWSSVIGESG